MGFRLWLKMLFRLPLRYILAHLQRSAQRSEITAVRLGSRLPATHPPRLRPFGFHPETKIDVKSKI
jgi:hypothetical protein